MAHQWRAGKAADTIAVVIISKLPVVCLESRMIQHRLNRPNHDRFNLQNYGFSFKYTNIPPQIINPHHYRPVRYIHPAVEDRNKASGLDLR